MAQEQLDGIANAQYNVDSTETLTWETATDWDNAVSESGVAHESVADTDHSDASTIVKGFSYTDLKARASILNFWPMHEDAGPTVVDIVNGDDGSEVGGPTYGVSGVANSTAVSGDGNDDHFDTTSSQDLNANLTHTVSFWYKAASGQGDNTIILGRRIDPGRGMDFWFNLSSTDDSIQYRVRNPGGAQDSIYSDGDWADGNWHFVSFVRDGDGAGNLEIYIDGTDIPTTQSNDNNAGTWTSSNTWSLFRDNKDEQGFFQGDLAEIWFDDAALTLSEHQAYYDAFANESSLVTATKSFTTARQPDLTDLAYSLNGQSIIIDVIGSPGQASEERVSQTLDGATSYTLSWTDTHADFRVEPRLNTSDVTTSPTVGSISLTG